MTQKLRVLDLFSGIGGFSLGLERTGGFETVAFCEIEEFPRRVLAKHWPNIPCFQDVRKLKGEDVGSVDVICGGYPCQPFSTAGRRKGKEDDRHLWPEFSRLVAELRPTWVIGENVAGHISMGLDDVLSDLEGQGYTCRTFVIPAVAVDAQHRRDRCWTIGHSYRDGKPTGAVNAKVAELLHVANARRGRCSGPSEGQDELARRAEAVSAGENVADTHQPRPQEHGRLRECPGERAVGAQRWSEPGKWLPEPPVGRVASGVPGRVDRLRALGNAVVPQIPEMIGRAILQSMEAA